MLDVFYWTAALLTLVGAIYSVRKVRSPAALVRAVAACPTAWALLASVGFYLFVKWTGLPFSRPVWIGVDLVVMAAIAWPMVPIIRARAWRWLGAYRKEIAILVLFPLCWLAYELPDDPAYVFTTIAATAQLLLTLPRLWMWHLLTQASNDMAGKDDFDLMVSA